MSDFFERDPLGRPRNLMQAEPLDEFEIARRRFSPQLNIGAEPPGQPAFMPMGDQNLMQQSIPQATPPAPAIRVSAALPTTTGPTINNGGILSSNFERAGDMSQLPNGGWTSQVHERPGGFPSGGANPYADQMNLMQQLRTMAQQDAPSLDYSSPAARAASERARETYIGEQTGNLMQHMAPGIMPNQLGQENLQLHRDQAYGTPGTPGSIATGAQGAIANTPAALEATRRQAVIMELTRQGMPMSQILEELNALPPLSGGGANIPNYLGTRGQQPVNPNTVSGAAGATTPTATPIQARIASVADRALQTFQGPAGPNGRRPLPVIPDYNGTNIEPINRAITNYFGSFTEDELTNNYEPIARMAGQRFGDIAMNGWQNTRFMGDGGPHGQQRARVMRQQGTTPPTSRWNQFGQNIRDIIGLPVAPFQSGEAGWDARMQRLGW